MAGRPRRRGIDVQQRTASRSPRRSKPPSNRCPAWRPWSRCDSNKFTSQTNRADSATLASPIRIGKGTMDVSLDLLTAVGNQKFGTVLADPPWRFLNRSGKIAPEHKRLNRYGTLSVEEICALPVREIVCDRAHLYLWVPNALLPEGLRVVESWGFSYKTNLIWHKVRKDGGSDGRGVGFYFRNVTEVLLFGVRGRDVRTLQRGRNQVNFVASRKREHSRKPDEQYSIIEDCSWGPFIELFARGRRRNWTNWGNQAGEGYTPSWSTYANCRSAGRLEAP